jgi:hypothetical protein
MASQLAVEPPAWQTQAGTTAGPCDFTPTQVLVEPEKSLMHGSSFMQPAAALLRVREAIGCIASRS